MPRKPGLSRDQHTALAEELAVMRDRLVKIVVMLGAAYPQPVTAKARRAQEEIDDLRTALERRMFEEYPDLKTTGETTPYYPKGPVAG